MLFNFFFYKPLTEFYFFTILDEISPVSLLPPSFQSPQLDFLGLHKPGRTSRPDVCFGCSKLALTVLDQLAAIAFVNWHSLEMGRHCSSLPPMWRRLSAKVLTTVPLEIRAPFRR